MYWINVENIAAILKELLSGMYCSKYNTCVIHGAANHDKQNLKRIDISELEAYQNYDKVIFFDDMKYKEVYVDLNVKENEHKLKKKKNVRLGRYTKLELDKPSKPNPMMWPTLNKHQKVQICHTNLALEWTVAGLYLCKFMKRRVSIF